MFGPVKNNIFLDYIWNNVYIHLKKKNLPQLQSLTTITKKEEKGKFNWNYCYDFGTPLLL